MHLLRISLNLEWFCNFKNLKANSTRIWSPKVLNEVDGLYKCVSNEKDDSTRILSDFFRKNLTFANLCSFCWIYECLWLSFITSNYFKVNETSFNAIRVANAAKIGAHRKDVRISFFIHMKVLGWTILMLFDCFYTC